MEKYASRTCEYCGIRKPQPQMIHKKVYVEVGKSSSDVSLFTWLGLLFGDNKSIHSINRWIFNTNQRKYKRKKQIWFCHECATRDKKMKFKKIFYSILFILIIVFVYYYYYLLTFK